MYNFPVHLIPSVSMYRSVVFDSKVDKHSSFNFRNSCLISTSSISYFLIFGLKLGHLATADWAYPPVPVPQPFPAENILTTYDSCHHEGLSYAIPRLRPMNKLAKYIFIFNYKKLSST